MIIFVLPLYNEIELNYPQIKVYSNSKLYNIKNSLAIPGYQDQPVGISCNCTFFPKLEEQEPSL